MTDEEQRRLRAIQRMRTKQCRICRRPVIWFHVDGANVAVDADQVGLVDDVVYSPERHGLHSCRNVR